jgi:hypothetical protein
MHIPGQPGKALRQTIYFPNGLNAIISSGSSDNAATIAINIASPVRRPKSTVGIKFEKTRIENPAMIVIEV